VTATSESQNTRSSTADIAGATAEAPPQQQQETGGGDTVSQPPSEQASGTQTGSGAQDEVPNSAEDQMDLLESAEAEDFRSQWTGVQVAFVDEPQRAVESADALVAEVMKKLAENFAQERSRLESQWARGDDVSTEDLRQALQRYRSFFNRLLTT
jgi:hypothetical protein